MKYREYIGEYYDGNMKWGENIVANKWSRLRPELPENSLYADEKLYIAELQRFIRAIPKPDGDVRLIAIDGIYGPETRREVIELQQYYGLPATGGVDNLTWDVIFSEYERAMKNRIGITEKKLMFPDGAIKLGESGVNVLLLQALINQLAEIYSNLTPVPFSGDYDEATEAAVAGLQQMMRMPADGNADRTTVAAMISIL